MIDLRKTLRFAIAIACACCFATLAPAQETTPRHDPPLRNKTLQSFATGQKPLFQNAKFAVYRNGKACPDQG